MTEAKCSI